MSKSIILLDPILTNFLSCKTLNNLACKCTDKSPISSKNITPVLANSNFPILPSLLAPLKAPFAYPKSSLSNKASGIAAQFMAINGLVHRFPSAWIDFAINSLPVPLSPVIKTVELDCATLLVLTLTSFIASLFPIIESIFLTSHLVFIF